MADDGQHLGRRTVLRNVAAGGALTVGAGTATGEDGWSPGPRTSAVAAVESQYGDVRTVEQLFDTYGRQLVDVLAEQGYVQRPHDVSVDSFVPTEEYAATDASGVATASPGLRGGTEVVDVRIRQRTDEHVIEYHVNPEARDAYATVSPLDGSDSAVAYPDGTVNSLATASCCPSTDCDGDCLGCGNYDCTDDVCDCTTDGIYYYQERYCCNQDTDTCECFCSWDTVGCECFDSSLACT